MSLQAYQKAQRSTESARDAEYRLIPQVTQALIEADKGAREDAGAFVDTLDWNRRVWSALAVDCAAKENGLPETLKAQIISLSLWVSRFSSEAAGTGASLEPLIDVNKAIMAGLARK